MTRLPIALTVLLVALALSACAPEDPFDGFEEVEEEAGFDSIAGKADSMVGPIVVTEVGDGFVELRNDGAEPVDLAGYLVSFSYRRVRLEPHAGRDHVVAPGALALIVDPDTAIPGRVPDSTPVVDTSRDVEELLAYSKRLIVRTPDKLVTDRVDARVAVETGIAVERRLTTQWEPSGVGATPGVRNTLHGDVFETHFALPQLQAENPLPGAMAAWIDGASVSLDAALYQLDHPAVVDAMVAAAERGVRVRVVTDSTYLDAADPAYQQAYGALAAAGIPVIGDGRTARQHNKFLVRDGRSVWTGSYNPVLEDGVSDNAVTIESRELAAAHTQQFEQMFAGAFGPAKQEGPGHEAYLDGARVRIYFSPTESPRERILEALRGAHRSIYFSEFSFYDGEMGEAMLDAVARGVDVRGVFDRRSASSATQYQPLVDAGLDVRRPYYDGLLHNKVILIDYGTRDPIVVTGSFNLSSKAATANDESVVMIHDPYVARDYYGMWRRIYDGCTGPNTDTTGQAPLAISEVYLESDGTPFVELANLDGAAVELSGLVLQDRDGVRVPLTGAVAGAERSAVPVDGADLDHADALELVDDRGRVVATFDDPAYPGGGLSLERTDLAAGDLDTGWRPSDLEGGTPGW